MRNPWLFQTAIHLIGLVLDYLLWLLPNCLFEVRGWHFARNSAETAILLQIICRKIPTHLLTPSDLVRLPRSRSYTPEQINPTANNTHHTTIGSSALTPPPSDTPNRHLATPPTLPFISFTAASHRLFTLCSSVNFAVSTASSHARRWAHLAGHRHHSLRWALRSRRVARRRRRVRIMWSFGALVAGIFGTCFGSAGRAG